MCHTEAPDESLLWQLCLCQRSSTNFKKAKLAFCPAACIQSVHSASHLPTPHSPSTTAFVTVPMAKRLQPYAHIYCSSRLPRASASSCLSRCTSAALLAASAWASSMACKQSSVLQPTIIQQAACFSRMAQQGWWAATRVSTQYVTARLWTSRNGS